VDEMDPHNLKPWDYEGWTTRHRFTLLLLQRMVAWVDSALGIWRASAAIEGENGVKIVRIPMQRTRVPSCNMGIACLSPAFKHPPNQQDREASAPRKNARVLKAVPHGRASQNR